MKTSFELPDTNQLAPTALLDDVIAAGDETLASLADSTTELIDAAADVAAEAIDLAGPTVIAAGPTIGRFVWRHKSWLVLAVLAGVVLIAVQKRRAGTSPTASEHAERTPSAAPDSARAAS